MLKCLKNTTLLFIFLNIFYFSSIIVIFKKIFFYESINFIDITLVPLLVPFVLAIIFIVLYLEELVSKYYFLFFEKNNCIHNYSDKLAFFSLALVVFLFLLYFRPPEEKILKVVSIKNNSVLLENNVTLEVEKSYLTSYYLDNPDNLFVKIKFIKNKPIVNHLSYKDLILLKVQK
jgi:hypothetical protein